MGLTGKAANDLLDQLLRDNERVRAEQLAVAKAKAAARGKDPFELAKLEAMCDTSREGRVDPVEVRAARFERMYYVEHPEYATLAELAQLVVTLGGY
jgi:hypothetical protein